MINIIIYFEWPIPGTRKFVVKGRNYVAPVIIFWLISFIMLTCSKLHQKVPVNYVFIGIHTLSNSYLLALLICASEVKEILYALAGTIAIVAGITVYAFRTEHFQVYHPAFYLLSSLTLVFGILSLFTGMIRAIWLTFLMCVVFSIYLLVDTVFMIRGKSKFLIQIKPDPSHAILAVMKLYIDVIGIFVTLLAVLSGDQ